MNFVETYRPSSSDVTTRFRALVLLQRPESWANVADVVLALRRQPGVSVDTFALPYDFSRKAERSSSARALAAFLEAAGESPRHWNPETAALQPGSYDAVILTGPYDRERPPNFHFSDLANVAATTVYIPYGLAVGAGMRNLKFQFGQATQCRSTLVVARSGFEKALYEKHCPAGSRHVMALGSPRLDRLLDLEAFAVDPSLTEAIGDRKAVLWNSHFSFLPKFSDGMEYSTFDTMAPEIFRFARATPDLCLIWRPHPRLFREVLDAGLLSEQGLLSLRREAAEIGVIIDERVDHRHSFAASHALMTDLGSFMVEYLVTNKPILFLRNPSGEKPNEEGLRIIAASESAETGAQAIEFLERVLLGVDIMAAARSACRKLVLPNLDGRSADRIAHQILRMTTSTDGEPSGTTLETFLEQLESIAEQKRRRGSPMRRWRRLVGDLRFSTAQFVKNSRFLLRLLRDRG